MGVWIFSLYFCHIFATNGFFSAMAAISVLDKLSKHASIKEQRNEIESDRNIVKTKKVTVSYPLFMQFIGFINNSVIDRIHNKFSTFNKCITRKRKKIKSILVFERKLK